MDNKLVCPICGEATFLVYGKYPRKDGLCKDCSQKLFNKEIEQCEDCGKWKNTREACTCKAPSKKDVAEKSKKEEIEDDLPDWLKTSKLQENTKQNDNIESIKIDQKIKCITCGYETEGKLFCKRCFKKYADKEILIKVKNCKEIIPLDDFYEGYYECDDGHVVKSMAERDIDDYLFANNIKHGYEVALPLQDENGKRITLHPDFCVFDERNNPLYYIEYWGYDDNNRDYTKTKKYKMPLYEKAGITLININAKNDLRNLKTNLQYKLSNFTYGISNFIDE